MTLSGVLIPEGATVASERLGGFRDQHLPDPKLQPGQVLRMGRSTRLCSP